MGKKGSWLSTLKRVFTPASKDRPFNVTDQKTAKEKKKWGIGKKHGETTSFFPLHREPSSIEKILGDAEREIARAQPTIPPPRRIHRPKSPISSPPVRPPSRYHYQISSNHYQTSTSHYQTLTNHYQISANRYQISAIKIQAEFRGYMARKTYRALKGLVRLQGVMRGQSVKRQTMNTMRCMQLLVRVQSQIHSRRIQMMETKSLQQQTSRMSDKDMESTFSKWSFTHHSDSERQEEWDDSVLTKEEIEAKMQRKVEAVMKRERALAYAYSRQLMKITPKSAYSALMEIKSGGFPLWWNWVENQVPDHHHYHHVESQTTTPQTKTNNNNSIAATPRFGKINEEAQRRPISGSRHTRIGSGNDGLRPSTATPMPAKQQRGLHERQLRDDESLTSCPAYAPVPNYMAPTVSAKAKVRSHEPSKKRFSFGLSDSIGSLRWNKGGGGSVIASKDTGSRRMSGKHRSTHSIGNMSIDSTVSLPVGFGRNPFK